jgi:hypothetical protein
VHFGAICEARLSDVDLTAIYKCIDRSLDLFDRTYSPESPGAGGWYHRLEAAIPGPSATAVALNAYLLAGRLPNRLSEGLEFLKSRQVSSSDDLIDGGWAVNTSAGKPVLEATSFVVRFLGFSHLMIGATAPDGMRGFHWIVRNQNPDGGWGSFIGQPSRVWLTAMAIRALLELNPNHESIASGVEWLLRARDPETAGWGEHAHGPATVTHTSYALTTLVDSRTGAEHPYVDEAIKKGFQWLQAQAYVSGAFDDSARIESYNISYSDDGHSVVWQNAIWHPSLPFILSALVRHPTGADPTLIGAVVERIIGFQSADGRWPNADGGDGISVWSVWPFVDALNDFIRVSPVRNADRVTILSADAILIRRGKDKSASLARLAWRYSFANSLGILRRYWAFAFLVAVLVAGIILTIVKVLTTTELVLALVLPIVLVIVQELMARGRPAPRRS